MKQQMERTISNLNRQFWFAPADAAEAAGRRRYRRAVVDEVRRHQYRHRAFCLVLIGGNLDDRSRPDTIRARRKQLQMDQTKLEPGHGIRGAHHPKIKGVDAAALFIAHEYARLGTKSIWPAMPRMDILIARYSKTYT